MFVSLYPMYFEVHDEAARKQLQSYVVFHQASYLQLYCSAKGQGIRYLLFTRPAVHRNHPGCGSNHL